MERTQPLALGEALKRARLAADLTQEALAERSGISIRTIRNLERGTLRRPRQDTRRLLEAALGLTALDLAPTPAARQSNATAAAPSPLREASRRPLPIPPTPLIGRALEVEAACALLRRPEVRLLTVCGPPGVGKTLVALEVAAQLQPEFADGVVFVPLAPIRDPSLVVSALAQALGLHERSADTLVEQVQQHLQQRSLLLLLDNFEQIASAAPLIAELLATCQQLHLLVTSRVPLHMRGEQEYPLAPLPLPDLPAVSDLETLAQVPSVALLLQRAQAVQPTFALTETNAAALAAICQRLDGLPLALELAAPRLKLLSPQALLTQLEHQRLALAGGACDLPLHQQTLRATLTWSYALLSPAEQRLLRRLAVCAGGCALDAVTPICTAAGPLDHDVLDSLARLVDHHLVQREAGTESDEVRVRLLETMREYGLEQLQAHQEVAVTQEAHASYYLRLAETAAPALTGPEQHRWFACLRREVDNFRAALGWAQAHGEIDHGLRLAGALWRFWYTCGQLTEGRHWLERALAAVRPAGATPAQALALHGAGWLAFGQGDYPQAREYHQAALEMSQALGDAQGIAQALNNLGGLARMEGDYPQATALFEESLACYRALEDQRGISALLGNLAAVAWEQGAYDQAQHLAEEGLALQQRIGNRTGAAITMEGLGLIALDQGDYARAQRWFEDCLELGRALGDGRRMARARGYLGKALQAQGYTAQATALYQESLVQTQAVEDTAGSAEIWGSLGEVALEAGNSQQAITYYQTSLALHYQLGEQRGMARALEGLAQAYNLGSAQSNREALLCASQLAALAAHMRVTTGMGTAPVERARLERLRASLRTLLGREAFEAAWNAGPALSLEALQRAELPSC